MPNSGDQKAVSIVAKFSFPEEVSSDVEQKFDETNCTQARLGLPEGVDPVKVRIFLFLLESSD